jgi:hypothetical protein
VWSNDPESYAGGSVAIGRASHAIQVKGDDPDKKRIPWFSRLGVGRGADNPTHNKFYVEKLLKLETGRKFWKRLRSTKDCKARRRTRRRYLFLHLCL